VRPTRLWSCAHVCMHGFEQGVYRETSLQTPSVGANSPSRWGPRFTPVSVSDPSLGGLETFLVQTFEPPVQICVPQYFWEVRGTH
jgi:hypothetical protein